jgi:uncharacterized protein YciI
LSYFLVTEVPGPAWEQARPRREQDGWDEHAAFVDGLAEEGLIVLGGPIGDPQVGPVLLVLEADNEDDIRARLADDPWMDSVLAIGSIRPWTLWVGTPPG